jgi:hypothetical protein
VWVAIASAPLRAIRVESQRAEDQCDDHRASTQAIGCVTLRDDKGN